LRRHELHLNYHIYSLVLCYNVYAFCLRTSKDPSVGEFDELIISEFYILFNLVLFRFSFILFYYYFLFEQFTLRFNKIYFRNEYWVEQSWSKRKRIRSWFGLEKCKDSTQKYDAPSQKLGTTRATPQNPFCCFFFSSKLLCFVV